MVIISIVLTASYWAFEHLKLPGNKILTFSL